MAEDMVKISGANLNATIGTLNASLVALQAKFAVNRDGAVCGPPHRIYSQLDPKVIY